MNKKENHKQELQAILDIFLKTRDEKKLLHYLISNSELPGRRANLELAEAFIEVVENYSIKDLKILWHQCEKMTNISSDEAPTNDPKEFLPFCGAWAMGSIGSISSIYFDRSLIKLKELANDSRWRIRESVAKGIHKLMVNEGEKVLAQLDNWIEKDNWLEMRAVTTGVAEPTLLRKIYIVKRSLELHKKIFNQIQSSNERKSEGFKVLRKAMGYTLSVVVQVIPKEGFEYLRELIDLDDNDINWIVKENIKKNRLTKNFPSEVISIKQMVK